MKCATALCIAAGLTSIPGVAVAQPQALSAPLAVQYNYMSGRGAKAQFMKINKMTANGNAAVKQRRIHSVDSWSGSFSLLGQVVPYTMVGDPPNKGGTTRVSTQLIPISFLFDQYADQNGNLITIDVNPAIAPMLGSPNFQSAWYGTGFTQFADAVQRAQFVSTEKDNWHTLLRAPRMLEPVQIEVPIGASVVLTLPNGTFFALMDRDFLLSQLNTILQLEPVEVDSLAIALTRNVLLYQGDASNCCVLGFHTAVETGGQGNRVRIQTFAFASWLDEGIFGDFVDALPLSHEISEWMNDPFVNNITPPWQFPDGSGNCQGNLETGDPVVVMPHPGFPVTIGNFTYHPQTEALLQWFSRESPSSAFQQAYSYPDMTELPSPSQACAH